MILIISQINIISLFFDSCEFFIFEAMIPIKAMIDILR